MALEAVTEGVYRYTGRRELTEEEKREGKERAARAIAIAQRQMKTGKVF